VTNLPDCWSDNADLATLGIKRTMPRWRFQQIWAFFRLTDPEDSRNTLNNGDEGYDPLFRVRPIYDAYRKFIQEFWKVGGRMTVDELLVADKHRLSDHRSIRKKPHPHGILGYLLASLVHLQNYPDIHICHNFMFCTANHPWTRQPGPKGGRGRVPVEFRGIGEGGCFAMTHMDELRQADALSAGTALFASKPCRPRMYCCLSYNLPTTLLPPCDAGLMKVYISGFEPSFT